MERVADALEVLISKDCAFCVLVDPVLRYSVNQGYIGLIHRIEFDDKQLYIKTVDEISKKYQQTRSYPLILVHNAGKEVMLPSYIVDDIIDYMTSLDDQTYLRIIIGELTWDALGDILVQPSSRLILGIVEALSSP